MTTYAHEMSKDVNASLEEHAVVGDVTREGASKQRKTDEIIVLTRIKLNDLKCNDSHFICFIAVAPVSICAFDHTR